MHLKSRFVSEDGSAIVEFVLVAIPLFLPIILFLNSFADVSDKEAIARSLARESVRGFALSHGDLAGYSAAQKIATDGGLALGLSEKEVGSLKVHIRCSSWPCITPRNRVSITISFTSSDGHREIRATAEELLSPWI